MRSRQGAAKPDVVGRGAPGRSRHSATRDGPRAREKGNSKVRWGIMAVLLSSCDGASSWQRARIVCELDRFGSSRPDGPDDCRYCLCGGCRHTRWSALTMIMVDHHHPRRPSSDDPRCKGRLRAFAPNENARGGGRLIDHANSGRTGHDGVPRSRSLRRWRVDDATRPALPLPERVRRVRGCRVPEPGWGW